MSIDSLTPKKFPLKQVALFGFLIIAFLLILFLSVISATITKNRAVLDLAQSPSAPMYTGANSMQGVAVSDSVSPSPYAEYGEGGILNGAPQGVEMPIIPPMKSNAPAGVAKIIKNADLALLVSDVEASAQMIEGVRKEFGGQIGNASFYDYTTTRSGDITIWVPSELFDAAIEKIKHGALRVTSERISVNDVSAQFVDIEAQIKNLRATEAQYLEIMKRSGKIPDVLSVAQALSQTRGAIERLQGQQNYLSRQVALSSIHITLTQDIVSGIAKNEWRPLAVITATFRETLRDLTGFIDLLLILLVRLPMFLLWIAFCGVILYGIGHLGGFFYRRIKKSLPPGDGSI